MERSEEWLERRYYRIINLGLRDGVFRVRYDEPYPNDARYLSSEVFAERKKKIESSAGDVGDKYKRYISVELYKDGELIDSVFNDQSSSFNTLGFLSKLRGVQDRAIQKFLYFDLIDAHYDTYLNDWLKKQIGIRSTPTSRQIKNKREL